MYQRYRDLAFGIVNKITAFYFKNQFALLKGSLLYYEISFGKAISQGIKNPKHTKWIFNRNIVIRQEWEVLKAAIKIFLQLFPERKIDRWLNDR